MRWFWNVIASIRRWWADRRRRHAFGPTVVLDSATDPARELAAGKLVLVGTAEKQKWLRFKCPCGCGDVMALNLMAAHCPHWRAERHDDGSLTVHPSVDSDNCGSHFWIRRSKIYWV